MRITTISSRLAALPAWTLALVLGMGGLAAAQETAQPEPGQAQFGPRANKQGQQPGQPPAPQIEVIAENGKWKVQCETVPGAEGQAPDRQCGMIQSTQNEKNPKAALTLVLVKAVAGDKTTINMRVIAPIGVFLPTGVALEIDGDAVGRVPFTRCMP